MSRKRIYAVMDDNGAAEVYKTQRERNHFIRTAPRAVWEAFNDEGEAWNWITTRSTSAVTCKAESSKLRVFKRESSIIDLSSSRSASPEQRRPQHSPPVFAPDIKPQHSTSKVLDLDPESPPACKGDPDIDVANEPPFPKPEPEINLSDEQLEIVRICEGGENLFFTGSAGTGKSVCLREIIKRLREIHGFGRVFVTASTGIAAINVGGTTLHSFAGVRLGKEPVEELYERIAGPLDRYHKPVKGAGKSFAYKRWCRARVLIIDEISMIDGRFFDKLEELARLIREDESPFGGIQLIICGDFFQLPPVPDNLTLEQKIPIKFAFEAESWNRCIPRIVSLKKIFRQREGDLIKMLNMIRIGRVNALGLSIFKSVEREVDYGDQIQPTELFPLRVQVEEANNARLEALTGEEQTYYAENIPGLDMNDNLISMPQACKLLDNTLAPRALRLRPGAQVMLTVNIRDFGLVNGSIGVVLRYERERETDVPRIPPDDDNIPFLRVETTKPATQPQTSWSRERFKDKKWQPNEEDEEDEDGEGRRRIRWPVVQFDNGVTAQVTPDTFEAVNAIGRIEATRIQVPLILAWALSIHKSQGQTLPRVKVNMRGIFEKGQAYVALSRATSLQGLQVLNFDATRIMTHSRVLEWSKNLGVINNDRDTGEDSDSQDEDDETLWD